MYVLSTLFHPGLLGGWGCHRHQPQGGIRMKVHGNARTCLHSRLLMVRRVREEEWTLAQAAEAAGVSVRTMPLSTVSVILTRIGLGRPSRLEPREPANRYEKSRAGELVHVDVKKLGRIARPGHRVTGRVSGGGQHRRAFELAGSSCTSRSTTRPASPTPRCSRTRRAERRPPSCGARTPSSRASASASSG